MAVSRICQCCGSEPVFTIMKNPRSTDLFLGYRAVFIKRDRFFIKSRLFKEIVTMKTRRVDPTLVYN